jgi:hypothetical protein
MAVLLPAPSQIIERFGFGCLQFSSSRTVPVVTFKGSGVLGHGIVRDLINLRHTFCAALIRVSSRSSRPEVVTKGAQGAMQKSLQLDFKDKVLSQGELP